jgi:hypothetical protein
MHEQLCRIAVPSAGRVATPGTRPSGRAKVTRFRATSLSNGPDAGSVADPVLGGLVDRMLRPPQPMGTRLAGTAAGRMPDGAAGRIRRATYTSTDVEASSAGRGPQRIRPRDGRLAAFDATISSDDVRFVVTTADGIPDGYPKVLGLTDEPQLSTFGFPDVRLVETDGGFTFAKTSATDSTAYSSVSVTELRESYGIKDLFMGDARLESELAKLAGNKAQGQIPATGNYDVHFVVSAEAAAAIRQLEQRHPDDFNQAFKLTLEVVANRVNSLAGTKYPTRQEAITALSSGLAPQLRLTHGDSPESWTAHLKAVLAELMGLSKLRDPIPGSEKPRPGVSRIDHLPSKTVVFPTTKEGTTPVCEVRVDTPNVAATTSPAELVTFKRLKAVTQETTIPDFHETTAKKPSFGQRDNLKFIFDVASPAFDPQSPHKGPLPKGTKCEAISEPVYDKKLRAYTCRVINRPYAEMKFSGLVFCSDLDKDTDVELVVKQAAAKWSTDDVLVIRTKARYSAELVEKPADKDGIGGGISDWNGCTVKVVGTAPYTGVEVPAELKEQDFYLVQIIKATTYAKADENQYLLGVPGCVLAKD